MEHNTYLWITALHTEDLQQAPCDCASQSHVYVVNDVRWDVRFANAVNQNIHSANNAVRSNVRSVPPTQAIPQMHASPIHKKTSWRRS